ncbi:hypothetical protein CLAIMM_00900 [Cladophialophora immunda]|nr:hypothetical protein CLAIMM_00900 [Cladophialophora immunda]
MVLVMQWIPWWRGNCMALQPLTPGFELSNPHNVEQRWCQSPAVGSIQLYWPVIPPDSVVPLACISILGDRRHPRPQTIPPTRTSNRPLLPPVYASFLPPFQTSVFLQTWRQRPQPLRTFSRKLLMDDLFLGADL